MTFATAVSICFGKYLHLSGRAGCAEYWWFFLFTVLASFVAQIIDGLIFGFTHEGDPGRHPITMLTAFITLFPSLAVGWRRMHDTGRPGWYILLPLLVVLATLIAVMIGFVGFGLLEQLGAEPEAMQGPVTALGVGGLTVAAVLVIVASALKLWWLTRPGDPDQNTYGPPPSHPETNPAT